jgi:hypothetical protein
VNSRTYWADQLAVSRRPVPHPLLATRLGNLLNCFRQYGWPDARFRFWFRAFNLLWVCALRTPLHDIERWRVRQRVESQPLAAPPLFIIGHWRSGTTHLHHLLSQDPQFGFVTLMQAAFPLDFLTAIGGPLLAALLPSNRLVDAVPVTLDSPWEEEMAMASFGPLSFFHAFFFPRQARRIYRQAVHFEDVAPARVEAWWRDYRYFLKKVQCAQPGRRLLLKNPSNSARAAALRQRFPGAKFIHIHRHPEEVYASTLFLLRTAQEAWALQTCGFETLRQTVLENYADLMEACVAQTRGIPKNELIEIPFASLESEPMAVIEQIYRRLELPDFATTAPRFRARLEKSNSFKKNELKLNETERDAVRSALAAVYGRWGYR